MVGRREGRSDHVHVLLFEAIVLELAEVLEALLALPLALLWYAN